jgi:hypothetical protein
MGVGGKGEGHDSFPRQLFQISLRESKLKGLWHSYELFPAGEKGAMDRAGSQCG